MAINILHPGMVSQKKLDLLLELTRIDSEAKKAALSYHLVKGRPESTSAILHDLDTSNFNKTLAKVEQTARIVEKIKEHDLWLDK